MQAGQFVQWTNDAEEFAYVGQIVKVANDRLTIATKIGEMSFDLNDGEVKQVRKPSNFETVSVKEVAKPVAKKVVKSGSKLEQAIKLFEGMEMPSRQESIDMIVAELGMTPAGASTYYYKVKAGK